MKFPVIEVGFSDSCCRPYSGLGTFPLKVLITCGYLELCHFNSVLVFIGCLLSMGANYPDSTVWCCLVRFK